MKVQQLVSFGILFATLVSCVKTESKKINIDIPKFEPVQIGKDISGHRCDLVSDSEQKEVLILLTDKAEGKRMVQFFDFISANLVSGGLVKIGDYTLLTFTLNPASHDGKYLSDSALLLNSHPDLLVQEEKVVSVSGFLNLDKDMNGTLEQKVQFMKEDGSLHMTELEEIAKIENCKVAVVKKI